MDEFVNGRLRATYLSQLEERMLPGVRAGVYARVFDEVFDFLGATDPKAWRREDLERFLALRIVNLEPGERTAYCQALGTLTELLEAHHDLAAEELSDELTVGEFVSEDTANAVASAETGQNPAVSPGEQTDFLGDTLQRLDDLEHELEEARIRPRREGPWRRDMVNVTTATRDENDATVMVRYNPHTNCLDITWKGFVQGASLRRVLRDGANRAERHGATGCLLDLRRASVLGQDDTDWFVDWIMTLGRNGIRKIAILGSKSAIAQMQLTRLCEQTGGLAALLPRHQRVTPALFDSASEALTWLAA